MTDPRCVYIAQTASAMFNAPHLADQITNAKETQQFINELSQKIL